LASGNTDLLIFLDTSRLPELNLWQHDDWTERSLLKSNKCMSSHSTGRLLYKFGHVAVSTDEMQNGKDEVGGPTPLDQRLLIIPINFVVDLTSLLP